MDTKSSNRHQKIVNAIIIVLIIFTQNLTAQNVLNQDLKRSNQIQLIEQCLTFQPLKDKIPVEVQTKNSKYSILNQEIEFKLPSDFKIKNKETILISKAEIHSGNPYFIFHLINIKKDKAWIRYSFIYTKNGIEYKIPVSVEFERKNSVWQKFYFQI